MRCLYLPPVTKSTIDQVVGLEIFLSITAVFVDTTERLCYKLRKPLSWCVVSFLNGVYRSTRLASEPFGIRP